MSIRDTLWELKKSLPFFKQKELMKKMQLLEERLEILHYMILTAADHNMKDQQIVCEISLAEHCNLNCYGCDHFAPLAKPEFADLEESRRDLTRLAELFGHRITAGLSKFQDWNCHQRNPASKAAGRVLAGVQEIQYCPTAYKIPH